MEDETDDTQLIFILLSVVASVFLAGGGYMVIGKFKRGAAAFVLSIPLWFVLLGWVVHILALFDALRLAIQGDIRWIEEGNGEEHR